GRGDGVFAASLGAGGGAGVAGGVGGGGRHGQVVGAVDQAGDVQAAHGPGAAGGGDRAAGDGVGAVADGQADAGAGVSGAGERRRVGPGDVDRREGRHHRRGRGDGVFAAGLGAGGGAGVAGGVGGGGRHGQVVGAVDQAGDVQAAHGPGAAGGGDRAAG